MQKSLCVRGLAALRFVFLSALAAIACAGLCTGARAQGDRGGIPGDFDYYILALSWSPTYCGGRGGGDGEGRGAYDDVFGDEERYGGWGNDDRGYGRRRHDDRGGGEEQCSGKRPYAFVLHGLWPQYDRKGWPEYCRIGARPWVPAETIDRMMDIMPSRRLIIQEYRKHGVCSGLSARQYFESARQAYRSIRIPDEFQDLTEPLTLSPETVRKAFLDANRQLTPDTMQIACSRNLLREVRICLGKDLAPRPCSRNEQNRQLCNYNTVTMPPVRGGGKGPHGGPTAGQGDRL